MPVVPPDPEHVPATPERAPRPSSSGVARRDSVELRALRRSGGHGRMVGWRSRDVVRSTALVVAVLLAVKLFWVAHVLFFVVFLGMLFGIAVSGGADYLERFHIRRGIGAAVIVVTFVALLFGVGAWVAPTLREQGTELRQKLPEAVDRVQEWIKKRQSGAIGLLVSEQERAAPAADAATPVPAARGAAPAQTLGTRPAAADTTGGARAPALHDEMRQRMS